MVQVSETKQFELEAIHFLQQAGMAVNSTDVALLAADIQLVASEQGENHTDEAFCSAMVLKHRIGGYANTEGYIACLRIPKR